jgi:DNA-binding response OmpR family regulator
MIVTVAGDDARFCEQLASLLEKQNHRPFIVARPGQVLEALKTQQPHLLVTAFASLEVVKQVMQSVRDLENLRTLPILCVNARGSSGDGVAVLDAGADDFIHRPFNPEIFLARVRTLLRRRIWSGAAPAEPVTALRSGPLSVELVSRQAVLDGDTLLLTRLEFDLLAQLMKNPDKVLKRQELLEAVWNYPRDVETRTLDKHVENVRRKLGQAGGLIETIHGVGYRFKPSGIANSLRR